MTIGCGLVAALVFLAAGVEGADWNPEVEAVEFVVDDEIVAGFCFAVSGVLPLVRMVFCPAFACINAGSSKMLTVPFGSNATELNSELLLLLLVPLLLPSAVIDDCSKMFCGGGAT